MNIYFEDTAYSVYEDDGLIKVVLTLDKPTYTNFSIQVTDVNVTTNSKSCRVHVHTYIDTYYIMLNSNCMICAN